MNPHDSQNQHVDYLSFYNMEGIEHRGCDFQDSSGSDFTSSEDETMNEMCDHVTRPAGRCAA